MARGKKKTDKENNMTENQDLEAVNSTTEEPTGPSLGIVDVRNAVNVIDFACEQGAFKGWKTIVQVQEVRNRLVTFLEAVAPAQTEEATSDSGEKTTESANEANS